MKSLLCLLVLQQIWLINSQLLTAGLFGAVSAGLYYWRQERCHTRQWAANEFINAADQYISGGKWIDYSPDFSTLRAKVFGQKMSVEAVIGHVKQHLRSDDPPKALVLSFHGDTGIGKTFLANQLARALYRQYRETGTSNFVHILVSTHFRASGRVNLERLKRLIEDGIVKCERSMFIIEEVDKYPTGFMDHLIPYLEYNVNIAGKQYNTRKAIFILLSNSGGKDINSIALEQRTNGISREALTLAHFATLINSGALTTEGGLAKSALVKRSFVDAFLPFLPLEKSHVKKCIEQYLRDYRNITKPLVSPGGAWIEMVAEQMPYLPEDTQLYSQFGCRRVKGVVDMML